MVGHCKQPAGIVNSNSFPTTFEQFFEREIQQGKPPL